MGIADSCGEIPKKIPSFSQAWENPSALPALRIQEILDWVGNGLKSHPDPRAGTSRYPRLIPAGLGHFQGFPALGMGLKVLSHPKHSRRFHDFVEFHPFIWEQPELLMIPHDDSWEFEVSQNKGAGMGSGPSLGMDPWDKHGALGRTPGILGSTFSRRKERKSWNCHSREFGIIQDSPDPKILLRIPARTFPSSPSPPHSMGKFPWDLLESMEWFSREFSHVH